MLRLVWPAVAALSVLAVAGGLWLMLPAVPTLPPPVRQVERMQADGSWRAVTLPDQIQREGGAAAHAVYRWQAPAAQALYVSGLIGSARLHVNGHLLLDELGPPGAPVPPRPRGGAALRWLDLPPELLQPQHNRFEMEVAAPRGLSVSPVLLGDRAPLRAAFDRKQVALVTGPHVVAALIGVLGLFTLALWARRPLERQYGFFGFGAVLWALHTLWTAAPRGGLPDPHRGVWWNTLYAAVVTMLVLFALRFAQRRLPTVERALLLALALTPAVLYGSVALGAFGPASDALRLALIVLAFGALAAVAQHAWYRRSMPSALFVLAGIASAGFGLRDWLVYRYGADNFPVPWTPYAGGPFILLVGWLLLDRFVRTAQSLEAVNQGLEQRVAQREAQLAENFERLAQAERAQAASDERQRLLRELHDGVGARLVHLQRRIEAGTLDPEGLRRDLQDGLADMRLASETLSPDRIDIADSVGNFLFRWEPLLRQAGVRPHWQIELPAGGPTLPAYEQLQLLRILQEAMTNVLRHADATTVTLQMVLDGERLQLDFRDDGVGVEPAARGRGLDAMRERAVALRGQFSVGTTPGGGTRIQLSVPLMPAIR